MIGLGTVLRGGHPIRDDAGRVHEMRPGEWPRSAAWHDDRTFQTMRTAHRLTRGYGVQRWVVLVLAFVMAFSLLMRLSLMSGLSGVHRTLITVGAVVASACVTWFVMFLVAGSGRTTAAGYLRRRSVCAVCAYDLRCIPLEEESGLTVCPECGAAWRIPGVGSDGARGRVE